MTHDERELLLIVAESLSGGSQPDGRIHELIDRIRDSAARRRSIEAYVMQQITMDLSNIIIMEPEPK